MKVTEKEIKQMIKMKNILAENLLRFGVKNLNESDKQRLAEADPGDPSQSTVDLSSDYASLRSALATYNNTFKSITGVDLVLFLRSSNKAPSQLLITTGGRQQQSGQGMSGDNFVLRYDIPTGVLKRRAATASSGVKFFTLSLDDGGKSIGSGPGGIWYFGLTADLMKKTKKVDQVKAAADVAGAAIATFFSKIKNSVPKNYVITKSRAYDDGTAELIFGAAEQ